LDETEKIDVLLPVQLLPIGPSARLKSSNTPVDGNSLPPEGVDVGVAEFVGVDVAVGVEVLVAVAVGV